MVEAFGGGYGAVVLPSVLMSGQVQSGSVGSALMELPALLLLAAGTAQDHGSAALVLPPLRPGPSGQGAVILPALQLLGQGRLVVVVTYEAYAVNLKPSNRAGKHEVTHYTNWPFDGIVRHGSRHYAWGPAGLFEIGGATDYNAAAPASPTPIAWDWTTTVTECGASQKKAMRQMTIGGKLGARSVATVSVGRASDYSYSYATSKGEREQNYRVKFGKGLDERYYSVGLAGSGICDVDTIDFDVEPLSRK